MSIMLPYRISPSTIEGAGWGLFIKDPAKKGQVIICPDQINGLYPEYVIAGMDPESDERKASARWFESTYTISTDWPPECCVNHSSHPTGLWHLGFIFATADLPAGTEITADYRFILGDGEESIFVDSETGEKVIGLNWAQNVYHTSRQLLDLFAATPVQE